jgi:hypothetical protein
VVVAIVAIAAFQVKAQDERVRLEPVGKDTYQLTYLKKCPCKVKVEINDQYGASLFSEIIQPKKSFTKPYNFQNFTEGEFDFKVTDADDAFVTKIKRTDEVNMVAGIMKLKGERAKVVVKGDFMAPVYVKIYDSNNIMIFDDYVDHERAFSRIYDLSKIKSNELRMEVVAESKLLATARF